MMSRVPIDDHDHFTDKQFAAIVQIVEGRVGIKLPQTKRVMVEGRLRKRVRALQLPDLCAYGDLLFRQNGLAAELVHLIDCVTTNKTDFFREPSHFTFLRDVAVPELIRQHGGRKAGLKLWSAASSTGAEAYTMAMVLQDMIAAGAPIQYAILGTDISTEVLKTARQAIYSQEFVAPVPAAMQARYVLRAKNPKEQRVRVVPELRRRVQFERLNLMDETYPFDRDVDIIFCRNVLIYFDKPTQEAVISRLVSHLRPGGYLMLGHSESMAGAECPGVKAVSPTIYRTALTSNPVKRAAA